MEELNETTLMEKIKELLLPEMTNISFNTYIKPLSIKSMNKNHIIFNCDCHYKKDPLQTKYASLILNTIQYITNIRVRNIM